MSSKYRPKQVNGAFNPGSRAWNQTPSIGPKTVFGKATQPASCGESYWTRPEFQADPANTDLRDYVHGDEMSQTLMRAIAFLGGVSLRTGCYFLHALSLPSIELLQKFIAENSTAHLACWDVKASDGDYDAMRRAILAKWRESKSPTDLRDILTKAMTLSELAGRAAVEQDA